MTLATGMAESILSARGLASLSDLAARQTLLAFDFDGTLAPIVSQPGDAYVPRALVPRLRSLAERYPVAVISGRDADDVSRRLGFRPAAVVGNHGADLHDSAEAQRSMIALAEYVSQRGPELGRVGVAIECKRHSMSFHFRHAPDPQRALEWLEGLLKGFDVPLRVFGGKFVVNAVPPGAPDKAEALRRLMRHFDSSSALFAGDDLTDEDVFRARITGVLGIHVFSGQPTAAPFLLPGVHAMTELVEVLLRLRGGPESPGP